MLPPLEPIDTPPTEIITLKKRIPSPAAALFIEFIRAAAKAMAKATSTADRGGWTRRGECHQAEPARPLYRPTSRPSRENVSWPVTFAAQAYVK
jgi:hypothetical protein